MHCKIANFFIVATIFSSILLCGRGAAQSEPYTAQLTLGSGKKPMIVVKNNSERPITALAITSDLSDSIHAAGVSGALESRIYYDAYINIRHDIPIFPHASTEIFLGYVLGSDLTKLTPRIRAVVFSDGSTAGEPEWAAALIGRRVRLHDQLVNIHDMLIAKLGLSSIGQLANDLTLAEVDMHKKVPQDEFRIMNDIAFDSVIRTLRTRHHDGSAESINRYVKKLEQRIAQLETFRLQGQPAGALVVPLPFQGEKIHDGSSRAGYRSVSRLQQTSFSEKLGMERIFADTYTCTLINQTATPVTTNGCQESSIDFELSLNMTQKDTTKNTSSVVTVNNGPYWAYGFCTETYYDCNGEEETVPTHNGAATGSSIAGSGYKEYYWTLTSWYAEEISCPCGAACSGCTPIEVFDDTETEPAEYIVVYSNSQCP